ncbi:hypothetical protein OROHE_008451 [Orobanche hederae]
MVQVLLVLVPLVLSSEEEAHDDILPDDNDDEDIEDDYGEIPSSSHRQPGNQNRPVLDEFI